MKKIKLTKNQFALIDNEDYEKVNKYKWFTQKHGKYFEANRDIRTKNKREVIKMHRYIMNCPKGLIIDHKNHNTLDNRKCNLRICTHSQNNMNAKSHKNTSSKYKGVAYKKESNKWRAYIGFNKKLIHLGYFNDEKQAAIVYNNAAIKYHREYAYLNQINS